MIQEHPITPPEELVDQWNEAWIDAKVKHEGLVTFVATQAARWGADQELQACCEWLDYHYPLVNCGALRAARRPKPPNKKQRGLTALEATNLKEDDPLLYQEILNAIEGLPNA